MLGGCIKYLQSLKQDETVLRGAEFREYSISPSTHLVLDGTTLQNLEVINLLWGVVFFCLLLDRFWQIQLMEGQEDRY